MSRYIHTNRQTDTTEAIDDDDDAADDDGDDDDVLMMLMLMQNESTPKNDEMIHEMTKMTMTTFLFLLLVAQTFYGCPGSQKKKTATLLLNQCVGIMCCVAWTWRSCLLTPMID